MGAAPAPVTEAEYDALLKKCSTPRACTDADFSRMLQYEEARDAAFTKKMLMYSPLIAAGLFAFVYFSDKK